MKQVPANRYVVFLVIAVLGLSVDLYTKHVVFADLGYRDDFRAPVAKGEHQLFEPAPNVEGQSRIYLTGWLKFRFLTSFNKGALWGIGQGLTWLFAGLTLVAVTGVLLWLFVFGAAESRWLTVTLAFIMSGALGNLWDRLALHGCLDGNGDAIYGVRDFLFFEFGTYQYPIFNFADAFLVTGAIMLFIQSFMAPPTENAVSPPTPEKTVSGENTIAESEPSGAGVVEQEGTATQ
jgi:signal peptidase II